jgi:hypothetical protein
MLAARRALRSPTKMTRPAMGFATATSPAPFGAVPLPAGLTLATATSPAPFGAAPLATGLATAHTGS